MFHKLLLLPVIAALTGCHTPVKENVLQQVNSQKGLTLFTNSGCTTCHSLTGEKRYGPPLNSILNSRIAVFREGKQDSITIDRQYIVRSIRNPESEKDIRFSRKKMPKPDLSDDDIESLADYIIMINRK
jgi:cytochrome c553